MRRAVSLPNAGDPEQLIELARAVEEHGWDDLLLWDGLQHDPVDELDVHDPWVLLGAMARETTRIRLGTGVSPPSRRRPWKLAKEVVTLDHLSGGRALLSVGLGGPDDGEFEAFGDRRSLRERAAETDEALGLLDLVLRGEPIDHDGDHFAVHAHLRPAAVQQPRPPIWIAATPPARRSRARAARWDGVICNVKLFDDQMPLSPAELDDYVGDLRDRPGFEIATMRDPRHAPEEYEDVGVTCLIEGWFPIGPDWLARFRHHLDKLWG